MASEEAEEEVSEAEATGAEAGSTEACGHTNAEYILLIELHHIRIFSTQTRTIFHLLNFFFLMVSTLYFHLYGGFLFALFWEGNSAFRISENRLLYLPLQHLLPVFFSCVIIKKCKCVFCPSSFKHYSVYFCGTKDCQVVTDKYFCQIVVEKDDDPLVLQHINECFLFLLFYLILVFFF